jgi:RND family efflux transporter, MFP subunit
MGVADLIDRDHAMKKLLALLGVLVLVLGWWAYRRKNAPPEAPFAKVSRETVVSTLITNGRMEPVEWTAVLAERSGVVEKLHTDRGTRVGRGDMLAEIGAENSKSDLAAAEARVAQARADLSVVEAGGRASDLAEIDGALARARVERENARKEQASLERLVAKQAATRQEAEDAARRVELADTQLQALEKKRAALVGKSDRASAEAKLREAEAAVDISRRQLEKTVIRAPIAGVVYDSTVRLGSYLNPGDPVAKVGRTEKVRVRVYVDEPELGRVAAGMPVTITWDALPNRSWKGTVERMPDQIAALGTRQVAEVVCVIDNPGGELLPGANVNAEIRSRVAENALTIPREALRRQSNVPGVLLLQGDKVVWRKVTLGVSAVTRVQVLEGLAEGDSVALPSEVTLEDGSPVRPAWR